MYLSEDTLMDSEYTKKVLKIATKEIQLKKTIKYYCTHPSKWLKFNYTINNKCFVIKDVEHNSHIAISGTT